MVCLEFSSITFTPLRGLKVDKNELNKRISTLIKEVNFLRSSPTVNEVELQRLLDILAEAKENLLKTL